ncbi:MAG: CcdB family protein [Pseudomonadota bacterium]
MFIPMPIQRKARCFLERVHGLYGAALGCNRDELSARARSHGLKPMQGTWWADRPISPQPEGQQPCRARWGVAPLANSCAIGGGLRLPSHPGKAAARPRIDREHVLVVQIQNDAFDELPTRVVIPLQRPRITLGSVPRRLGQTVVVNGESLFLGVHFIATVPAKMLKTCLENIGAQQAVITDAMDALQSGV